MTVRVDWKGAQVQASVREACAKGLNHTARETVSLIKYGAHEYMDRTGRETESTVVDKEATPVDLTVRWGAFAKKESGEGSYSAYLEVGTSRPDSGSPTAIERIAAAQGRMWDIPPPQPPGMHTDTIWIGGRKVPGKGPLMTARLALRPAAEIEYPLLPEHIATAYHEIALVSQYRAFFTT